MSKNTKPFVGCRCYGSKCCLGIIKDWWARDNQIIFSLIDEISRRDAGEISLPSIYSIHCQSRVWDKRSIDEWFRLNALSNTGIPENLESRPQSSSTVVAGVGASDVHAVVSTHHSYYLGGVLPSELQQFHNISLGSSVSIMKDCFVDDFDRMGALWWIGRNESDEWFGVVELYPFEANKIKNLSWKSDDGIWSQQRLWHVQSSRAAVLIPLNFLQLEKPIRYYQDATLTTVNGINHLGCPVILTNKDNSLVKGRLLWSGVVYHKPVCCVVLERFNWNHNVLSDRLVDNLCDPNRVHGCSGKRVMVNVEHVVFEDEHCKTTVSAPKAIEAPLKEQVVNMISAAGTFAMCEIPPVENASLTKIVMGHLVDVDGDFFQDKKERRGRIAWLGVGRQSNTCFAVVQMQEGEMDPIDKDSYSRSGVWNGQLLYHNRRSNSCLLLVPALFLAAVENVRTLPSDAVFGAISSWKNHLGCEVRIEGRSGCLLWTGSINHQPYVCVKEKECRHSQLEYAYDGGQCVSRSWVVPDFHGQLSLVPATSIAFIQETCGASTSSSMNTVQQIQRTDFTSTAGTLIACEVPEDVDTLLHQPAIGTICCVTREFFKEKMARIGRIAWLGVGNTSGHYFAVVQMEELEMEPIYEWSYSTDGVWNGEQLVHNSSPSTCLLLVPLRYLEPAAENSIKPNEHGRYNPLVLPQDNAECSSKVESTSSFRAGPTSTPAQVVQEKQPTDFISNAGTFTMCEIPQNESDVLHKVVIGNLINVDGGYFKDNKMRRGRIAWLGVGDKSRVYFAVVQMEVSKMEPIDELSYSVNGIWNEQRLIHPRSAESVVLLVPIDYLEPVVFEGQTTLRKCPSSCIFGGLGFDVHLGCRVKVDASWDGCLMWLGTIDDKKMACVKEICRGIASHRTSGRLEGAAVVSKNWSIRGFDGDLIIVPANSIEFYCTECRPQRSKVSTEPMEVVKHSTESTSVQENYPNPQQPVSEEPMEGLEYPNESKAAQETHSNPQQPGHPLHPKQSPEVGEENEKNHVPMAQTTPELSADHLGHSPPKNSSEAFRTDGGSFERMAERTPNASADHHARDHVSDSSKNIPSSKRGQGSHHAAEIQSNTAKVETSQSNAITEKRFILMEIPHLQGVRLGETVQVKRGSRHLDGILKWKGKYGDEEITIVEFNKGSVDPDKKREFFDGFRLPQYDESSCVPRIVNPEDIVKEEVAKLFHYPSDIQIGEIFNEPRNHLNRLVVVSIDSSRIKAKLLWTGFMDGQPLAVVQLLEKPFGIKQPLQPENFIKCGAYVNEIIVVSPENIFLCEDVNNETPVIKHQFSDGDVVVTEYEGTHLVGSITSINKKAPHLVKMKVLGALDNDETTNVEALENHVIQIESVNGIRLLAKEMKIKDIPPHYSISKHLDKNKRMKFVAKDKKWIGHVKWIGIIHRDWCEAVFPEYEGDWFAALEVDEGYKCPMVAKYAVLRTLLGPLSKGKAPLIVPAEYVDPVYEADEPPPRTEVVQKVKNIPPPVYFDIPHSLEYFQHVAEVQDGEVPIDMGLGHAVEVLFKNVNMWRTGVCRWMGKHRPSNTFLVGVELDEKTFMGGSDGSFPVNENVKERIPLFQCRPQFGVVVPQEYVREDYRNVIVREAEQRAYNKLEVRLKCKNPDPVELEQDEHALIWSGEYDRQNGIQGRANSCYMDSSLFAMFAMNHSLDNIIFDESKKDDPMRAIIKNYIINPLRRDAFVGQANIMHFRKEFERIGQTKGMTYDQKDAEEFMSVLFDRILGIPPLLKFTDNQNTSIFQMFFTEVVTIMSPTQMLELTLKDWGDSKFQESPLNLVMLIPREGSNFAGFQFLDMDLQIKMGKFLDKPGSSKVCYCRAPAAYSYVICDPPEYLCEEHKNQCLQRGSIDEKLIVGMEQTLELYAVLCIQSCHYVTFVRELDEIGENRKWFFFDSMATRAADTNVPEIVEVEGMETAVKNYSSNLRKNGRPDSSVDPYVRRLFNTAYVLLYRSEELMPYN